MRHHASHDLLADDLEAVHRNATLAAVAEAGYYRVSADPAPDPEALAGVSRLLAGAVARKRLARRRRHLALAATPRTYRHQARELVERFALLIPGDQRDALAAFKVGPDAIRSALVALGEFSVRGFDDPDGVVALRAWYGLALDLLAGGARNALLACLRRSTVAQLHAHVASGPRLTPALAEQDTGPPGPSVLRRMTRALVAGDSAPPLTTSCPAEAVRV